MSAEHCLGALKTLKSARATQELTEHEFQEFKDALLTKFASIPAVNISKIYAAEGVTNILKRNTYEKNSTQTNSQNNMAQHNNMPPPPPMPKETHKRKKIKTTLNSLPIQNNTSTSSSSSRGSTSSHENSNKKNTNNYIEHKEQHANKEQHVTSIQDLKNELNNVTRKDYMTIGQLQSEFQKVVGRAPRGRYAKDRNWLIQNIDMRTRNKPISTSYKKIKSGDV